MNTLLIYSKEEAERNSFAVSVFEKELGAKLVLQNEVSFDEKADCVINRTNSGEIALCFEKRGIRVFNPSSLSFLANDKQHCYEFMSQNGIEIMPVNQTKAPVVIKPTDGKGGQGVRLVESGEFEIEDGFVYQKPASDLGKDLRVWLIGGEIICSILRESKTDFRSNFCLGGNATPYTLSAEETALVMKIQSLIKYDYIGIDFVFDNGRAVFNEIEDSVGARMVYTCTNTDILSLYCDYIKKEMS